MTTVCRSDLGPSHCCQPALTTAEVAGIEYRAARQGETSRGEISRCCPWLGHRSVTPSFETSRRTWFCWDCVREFTPGVIG